jgi:cytochrome c
MTRNHGLWDVKGRGDVANPACMRNCATEVHLASALPEQARGSHGDLAQQMRSLGAARASGSAPVTQVAVVEPDASKDSAGDVIDLARRKACLSCHAIDKRIVGPAFKEVAARYRAQAGIEAKLVEKLRGGGSGSWGPLPMPPNPDLAEPDARALVRWVLGL